MGWLDIDAAASERVATLLRSLEEPGTLDVLGLGTIRDAFADMLSPGTSTVQTRLRYFIFLPWIFQHLETDRVPATDFARRLRDAEAKLIDCLRRGKDEGVIGSRAGPNLAAYRLAFGQPRQEELVEFLGDNLSEEDLKRLRIDLSPPC